VQFWQPGKNDDLSQLDLYQAWLSQGLGKWLVRGGRQELVFGEGRLLGNGDWANYGRTWDSFRVDYSSRAANISAFGGQVGINGKTPISHPDLAGIYSTLSLRPYTLDLYYLYKRAPVAASEARVNTIGARFVTKQPGPFSATAEAVGQYGKTANKDLHSAAAVVTASYTIKGSWSPKLTLEMAYASGGDPAAATVRTFDQLYPTNHRYYGIADLQGWRNVRAFRIEAGVVPAPRWSVTAAFNSFQLDNAKDFWYGDNGQPNNGPGGPFRDPSGQSGREIGTEADLVVSYSPSNSWALDAGWGHFMPGDFVKKLAGTNTPQDFLYVQLRYRR